MKRLIVPILGAALIGGAAAGVGLTAFAKDEGAKTGGMVGLMHEGTHATSTPGIGIGVRMHQDVAGTVTAINGSTITVTALAGGTYTIDATNANIKKFAASSTPAVITIGSVAVGDKVLIRGSITTASMTAGDIFDGAPPMRIPGKEKGDTK